MKYLLTTFLCIWIISLSSCQTQEGPVTIEEANRLYFQRKATRALQYYETIWHSHTYSNDDRAGAARMTAKMLWLFYEKTTEAIDILEDLDSLNSLDYKPARTYLLWSRILRTRNDYTAATLMAKKAKAAAKANLEKYDAEIAWIQAILDEFRDANIEELFSKEEMPPNLSESHQVINAILHEKPGDITVSNLALGINLLLRDWPNAYKSWLSFYRYGNKEAVHKTLVPAHEKMISGLGISDTLDFDIEQLVLGLAESGFINYAASVAKQFYDESSKIPALVNDVVVYHEFIQDLKSITTALYHATVTNSQSESTYKSKFYQLAEKLWNKLSWQHDVPSFSKQQFESELRTRFNAIYEFQNSNGHFGLHMGHIVFDDQQIIRQHGKEASLRYIAIDHMVSNGYSSWFWDGVAATGGWTRKDYFLQVRSSYNKGPVDAWLMVSDSAEVESTKREIVEKSALDDSIAKADPFAFLPGTSYRILFNLRMRLLDSLKSAGYTGADLRFAFINKYEEKVRNSSIFAHEGRHAIDDIHSGFIWAAEDEFRAKLSEIYFADDPFIGLRAVFSQNIGDGTSHGKANLKVMKGLVGWIEKHTDEIAGYDKQRPALPQLDLLTPGQLRLAVKSMDPLVD